MFAGLSNRHREKAKQEMRSRIHRECLYEKKGGISLVKDHMGVWMPLQKNIMFTCKRIGTVQIYCDSQTSIFLRIKVIFSGLIIRITGPKAPLPRQGTRPDMRDVKSKDFFCLPPDCIILIPGTLKNIKN